MLELVPWGLFGLMLAANVALAVLLARALKKPPPKETFDVTAQDLLHDLTRRGAAILRVEVIDPTHLMLRSPRG